MDHAQEQLFLLRQLFHGGTPFHLGAEVIHLRMA